MIIFREHHVQIGIIWLRQPYMIGRYRVILSEFLHPYFLPTIIMTVSTVIN